jgi:DNA-binding GntR family transcriptional regulator
MNLSDEVYVALKAKIVDWTFPPGTALQESQITKEVGASRTPVRAALLQLSRDGLVRLVPGMGAFVTDISMADVTEMYEMREALEALAAKLAARSEHRGSLSEFIPRFKVFQEKFENDELAPDALTEVKQAYYRLSSELDRAIVNLACNSRLTVALGQLWSEIHRARRVASSRPDRLRASIPEHISIVYAIVAGDSETAEAVTARHVNRALHHVRENLVNGASVPGYLKLTGTIGLLPTLANDV